MHILYTVGAMIFCILTVQCAEIGTIKSTNNQVRDLIFADYSRFSHEDLMAFGLASKDNDAYLRETSQKRKNYFLIRRVMAKERHESFQWHGYGSRADLKKIVNDCFSCATAKRLILERLELSDKGKIHSYYGSWGNFEAELSYKPAPFYSADKRLCFFGVGWEHVPNYGRCGNVICYSTRPKRDCMDKENIEALRCILCCGEYANNQNQEPLYQILEFPRLLKSILACKLVEKRIVPNDIKDDCYLLYHLKDIVIPENYKDFMQHEWKITYESFNALPQNLQKAITEQYENQQIR